MWVAQEPDYVGHCWLEEAAVFRVRDSVDGEGLAVVEEFCQEAVLAVDALAHDSLWRGDLGCEC